MQTNPAVEQNKNIKWSGSPWIQSGRQHKLYFDKISVSVSINKTRSHGLWSSAGSTAMYGKHFLWCSINTVN